MPEPLTLAAVGGVVLTEGIKFLYGQAAEAVTRWRESRQSPSQPEPKPAPAALAPPAIFEGQLAPLEFHLDKVDQLEEHLLKLRGALTNYADGLEPVDSNDGSC